MTSTGEVLLNEDKARSKSPGPSGGGGSGGGGGGGAACEQLLCGGASLSHWDKLLAMPLENWRKMVPPRAAWTGPRWPELRSVMLGLSSSLYFLGSVAGHLLSGRDMRTSWELRVWFVVSFFSTFSDWILRPYYWPNVVDVWTATCLGGGTFMAKPLQQWDGRWGVGWRESGAPHWSPFAMAVLWSSPLHAVECIRRSRAATSFEQFARWHSAWHLAGGI